jgi:hypothetical protein
MLNNKLLENGRNKLPFRSIRVVQTCYNTIISYVIYTRPRTDNNDCVHLSVSQSSCNVITIISVRRYLRNEKVIKLYDDKNQRFYKNHKSS